MKFYSIKPEWEKNITGHYEPVKEVLFPCHIEDDLYIQAAKLFRPLDKPYLLPTLILEKEANLCDMLNIPGIFGLTFRLVVSQKLKSLMLEMNFDSIEFRPIEILQNGENIDGYFLVHPSKQDVNLIDVKHSQAGIYNLVKQLEELPIRSILDFKDKERLYRQNGFKDRKIAYVRWTRLKLEPHSKNLLILDLIHRKGLYHVSEKFKAACEMSGMTGIEFIPNSVIDS